MRNPEIPLYIQILNFAHMARLRFYKTPNIVQKAFPAYTWRRQAFCKKLYLTFDDGPGSETTPWIIDTLNRYQAKATFFCVGANVFNHGDLLQTILSNGHSVGNHTHLHLDGWKNSASKYVRDVEECGKHFPSSYFRPPYGKITKQQAGILRNKGFEIVLWDVLSYDFDNTVNPDRALQKIVSYAKPGSIIVFHDNIKAINNLKVILPRFLDQFYQLGYSFPPL